MGEVETAAASCRRALRHGARVLYRARFIPPNTAAVPQNQSGGFRGRCDICCNSRRTAFFYRQSCRLDGDSLAAARTGENGNADTGILQPPYARNVLCVCGNDFAYSCKRLCGTDKENRFTAADVFLAYDSFSNHICAYSGYPPSARRRYFHMGFCFEPRLGQCGARHMDACKRLLGGRKSKKAERGV